MTKEEFRRYFRNYKSKKKKTIDIEEIKNTVTIDNPITIKGDYIFFLPRFYPDYGIRYMSWKRYQELKTFLSFELRNQTDKERLVEHNLIMYSKSIDDYNPELGYKMRIEMINGVPVYVFEGDYPTDDEIFERRHEIDILRTEEKKYEGLPPKLANWLKNFVKKLRGD